MTKNKILVLGSAKHGKDQFAEYLCKYNINLTFRSSSLFVCEKAVFPTLSAKYGYTSIQQCYEDRHDHRTEWFDLISAYNNPKYRLASEIFDSYNIYVGLRNKEEYLAGCEQKLFDTIFWIDAYQRIGKLESRVSFNIDYDKETMFWIDNNGSLEQLECTAKKFARLL